MAGELPVPNKKNPNVEAQTLQRGDILKVIAPAGGYQSGDVVQVAGKAGVVNSDVAEGELANAQITGVYLFDNSGITPTAGTKVAFDDTAKNAVATTLGDFELGTVVYDVAAGTDAIAVLINENPFS